MWLFIGILVGALAVYMWQRLKGRRPAWYTWVLMLVGLADLLVTVEAVTGSIAEGEPTAATRFVMIGAIVLVIAWGLAWRLATGKAAAKPGKAVKA